jgi:hypothetical protein
VTTQTWVDLAPLVEPTKAWLRTETGKTVTFGRAPKGGVPPFTVLAIVSDARLIESLDGGIPADVTWQLDSMGENPLQALGMHDKALRAMVLATPPVLTTAYVSAREAVGDTQGPRKESDNHFVVQSRVRWTLVGVA